jgi:uncharacterized protein (TIGR02757 family)
MKKKSLINFLNQKVEQYNQPDFIKEDPISIPHRFSLKQDKEISGFFASIFAWGNRRIIINKTTELMKRMDNAPHQFITQHQERDREKLLGFVHRTFNDTDLLYFVEFLQQHYLRYGSLEDAFTRSMKKGDTNVENALRGFYNYFFSLEYVPQRTTKHIATPARKSSCKRINMYLRWMVRKDNGGVDFGIWQQIKPHQLICPIDLHVARVAKRFQLLDRPQTDWLAAVELTDYLKKLDPEDPAKYDFALFGLGVVEKFS